MSDIYQVGHLERVPLGTLYPGIVAHVRRLLGKLPNAALIIDYTGVGRPVFDLFTSAGISPVGVLITGGAVETHDGAIYGVPKLTLVSRLQALLHEGRLKIHKELSEAVTGFDPVSFAVEDRADVEAWVAHLDEQGVENSGLRIAAIGYIVFFHDPDGIKLHVYSYSTPRPDEIEA